MDLRLRRRVRAAYRAFRGPKKPPVPSKPGASGCQATGPPGYVGIGAMRAGTSWWHRLISAHPEVVVAPGAPKELHFFDTFATAEFTPPAVAEYHAYFPRRHGATTGEWTPSYLCDPWVPPLLKEAAPSARLLVMLRDPVDRYVSGIAFSRSLGSDETTGSHRDHFHRGLYHAQLERYLLHFPRLQVLVLQFERCVVAPEAEIRRTFEFLELDPGFQPVDLRRPVNASGGGFALDPAQRQRLKEAYGPDLQRLAGVWPEIDLDLWASARVLGA